MFTIRARVAAAGGAVALAAAGFVAIAAPAQADSGLGKIGFCHATGSTTHPYVYQSTSWNNILSWSAKSSIDNGNHSYDLIPAVGAFGGQFLPISTIVPGQCAVAEAAAAASLGLGSDSYSAAEYAAQAVNAASPSAIAANPSAAVAAATADATATATTASASTATVAPSATASPSVVTLVYSDAVTSTNGLVAY
ncbi:hypothetical protein QDR37_14390 [Amnibacterium sp. CER49]|uniref:hypothetical protein n=1 Tax=Amnibacterium sp. CER49 TaxID=3039161 RepID=UPI002446C327|nr:hypothetical protein [Amnibacterium sp. CER49]MDH2445139.1 hypothetical protein [Amnibacterium sp. CER49]